MREGSGLLLTSIDLKEKRKEKKMGPFDLECPQCGEDEFEITEYLQKTITKIYRNSVMVTRFSVGGIGARGKPLKIKCLGCGHEWEDAGGRERIGYIRLKEGDGCSRILHGYGLPKPPSC